MVIDLLFWANLQFKTHHFLRWDHTELSILLSTNLLLNHLGLRGSWLGLLLSGLSPSVALLSAEGRRGRVPH